MITNKNSKCSANIITKIIAANPNIIPAFLENFPLMNLLILPFIIPKIIPTNIGNTNKTKNMKTSKNFSF